MPEDLDEQESERAEATIGGFWRRLGAYIIDAMVLGLVGWIIGLLFYDFWVHQEILIGRMTGFVIALGYFGPCYSEITGGQTVGKYLLGLKVRDIDGTELSPARGCLRFSILGLPYFLNGLQFPASWVTNQSVMNIFGVFMPFLAMFVFGFGPVILYLFVFNRNTRQSLHDLLVNSVVVETGSAGKPVNNKTWWFHKLIAYGWPALIIVGGFVLTLTVSSGYKFGFKNTFQKVTGLYKKVVSYPGVMEAKVTKMNTGVVSIQEGQRSTTGIQIWARIAGAPESHSRRMNDFVEEVVNEYQAGKDVDYIHVTTTYGYDLGIASFYRNQTRRMNPSRLTDLMSAIRNGNVSKASDMIRRGFDADRKMTYKDMTLRQDQLALIRSVSKGYSKLVKQLLDRGVSVDFEQYTGSTLLMRAAHYDRPEVIRILIKQGADVNETNADGETALIYAGYYGSMESAKVLLEHGADPATADKAGNTAIDWARRRGHERTVRILSDFEQGQ